MLRLVLGDKLRELKKNGVPVPSTKKLADMVGVHEDTLYKLLNNEFISVNRETLGKLLVVLQDLGIEITEADLFKLSS